MQDKFLTYKELAERWKRPVNTLRIWVMEKRLKPSFKAGSCVLFTESYIREIEAKGRV